MIVTNGHCYEDGLIDFGDAVVGAVSKRVFLLMTRDGAWVAASLMATRVLYATMTDTDSALYELATTFEAIAREHGIDPLTIDDHGAAAGAPIAIVSGLRRTTYVCAVDALVHEIDESWWKWRSAIRYTQPGCFATHGTSGSPVIDRRTGLVVGIHNTFDSGGERCTMDNPCEVEADGGVATMSGAAYGQQLFWIYGCLTPSNAVDLSRPGCRLTKPRDTARDRRTDPASHGLGTSRPEPGPRKLGPSRREVIAL